MIGQTVNLPDLIGSFESPSLFAGLTLELSIRSLETRMAIKPWKPLLVTRYQPLWYLLLLTQRTAQTGKEKVLRVMCALFCIQFWFHSGAMIKHFLQKQLGEERISLARILQGLNQIVKSEQELEAGTREDS